MHKLKNPLDPLLGSPLTDEELKSILGGQTDVTKRTCICNYQVGIVSGNIKSYTVGLDNVGSESDCDTRCKSLCKTANGSSCPWYSIVYTVSKDSL